MSDAELKMAVSLDRLFLATDNPRHEEVADEGAAIERLCSTENIEQLAQDIARHGVNPAERFIVYPIDEDEKIDGDSNFVVAEGNRRMCALKLLSDPDLAPAKIRRRIEQYSDTWAPISEVDVVVILDEDRRRHWLLRIHDGAQGGRGRMAWKAEQKTRFTGSGRNVMAQAFFNYCEQRAILNPGERAGRISHMARLLANPLIRDALGLDTSEGAEGLNRTRPPADFDLIAKELVEECRTKSLGSQALKKDIDKFAHTLQQLEDLSGERIDPTPLHSTSETEGNSDDVDEDGDADPAKGRPKQPRPPRHSSHLKWSQEISDDLHEADCQKLSALYYSICAVNSKRHAPLVAVGVWVFLESLAATCGAKGVAFKDFWKRGKLSQMGVAKGNPAKAMSEALTRLSQAGNTTKHDAISAHFDSQQLKNDWDKVQPLIAAAVKEVRESD